MSDVIYLSNNIKSCSAFCHMNWRFKLQTKVFFLHSAESALPNFMWSVYAMGLRGKVDKVGVLITRVITQVNRWLSCWVAVISLGYGPWARASLWLSAGAGWSVIYGWQSRPQFETCRCKIMLLQTRLHTQKTDFQLRSCTSLQQLYLCCFMNVK